MAHVFVRVCAALIIFRSLTNFRKLFLGDEAMLVAFGQILRGSEVFVPALLVGLLMLVTGIAMWRGNVWALPLIGVYAAYVAVNLVVWTAMNPDEFQRVGAIVSSATEPRELRRFGILAFIGYCVVATGTTAAPAWVLWKGRGAGGW